MDRSSLDRLRQQLFSDTPSGRGGLDGLRARFHQEVSHAMRRGEEIGILLVGLDLIEEAGDRPGPLVVGSLIEAVAAAVDEGVRDEGSVFRYEGEEFCVLARGLAEPSLKVMAERIRSAVEQLEVSTDQGGVRVTISIGCASIVPARPSAEDTQVGGSGTLDDMVHNALLSLAGLALRRARDAGGNCIRGAFDTPG